MNRPVGLPSCREAVADVTAITARRGKDILQFSHETLVFRSVMNVLRWPFLYSQRHCLNPVTIDLQKADKGSGEGLAK